MTKKVAAQKALLQHTIEEQYSKSEERNRATIARAKTCHMSNAKWRKVFTALGSLDTGILRWKFVREDRIFESRAPWANQILEDRLGDVMPGPYTPFREIDWIEVPLDRADGAIEALEALGQFPVLHTESGVRIVGYSW